MEMLIDLPGGARLYAHFGSFTFQTGQPPRGHALTPFEMFLSSIGACAGKNVVDFCQKRKPTT